MELSSPVGSLVPSLVLNAVVTFEGWLFGLRRSRLGECPFCATRAAVTGSGEDVARKRNRDRKTTNAALPVMRPDAAGPAEIGYRALELVSRLLPDPDVLESPAA